MKIEPCPFCEEEVRFDLGDLSAKCVSCFYTGPTDDNEAAAHNRLSRIVRAAERLIRAREALVEAFAQMDMDYPHFSVSQKADGLTRDVDDANRELTKAVNGKGGVEG